jgi:hypothetical protein
MRARLRTPIVQARRIYMSEFVSQNIRANMRNVEEDFVTIPGS